MLIIFFAIFTFVGVLGSGCNQNGKTPDWGPAYSGRGLLSIPYAELREPFIAWYDSKSGASRIDFYGGVVKTFQLSKMGSYGSMLKIVPVTTDTQLNVPSCLQLNGTAASKVVPQAMLPDLTNFKCVGSELINGVDCEKWTYTDTVGDKVNKYFMWLRWTETKTPIPVQYEMLGFNSLLGSHYDHYFITYSMFSNETPLPGVFKISSGMTCTHFPGPGHQHAATFNPFREFIHNDERHVDHAWEKFKTQHNKKYNEEQNEHHMRKTIFKQNFRYIQSKNRANLGYQLSVNHLADKTDSEIAALRGRRYSVQDNGASNFPYSEEELTSMINNIPNQHDWRLYGAVTPVKDQSVCGSCWSFGTTGTIEGAYFVNKGHLLRLSQQALMDCSWGEGNNGCDGGEDFRSYKWIMKQGGLPLEAEYGGYLGQDSFCHVDKTKLVAKITGYVNVTSGNENALRIAIFQKGPISVSIDAAHKSFSFYSNGIFYEPECKNKPDELDHSVLAVGYGSMNGQNYWLIKNSWSNLWGNDGYVLMSSKNNNCGVMTSPTYVTM